MYLLIPLLLFAGSLGAVGFIVWRKMPYVKKLASARGSDGSATVSNKDFFLNLFSGLWPEMISFFKGIEFNKHKDAWLTEAEKLLRRLRLLSLRMDRFSNTLIHKIRNVTRESVKEEKVLPAESPHISSAHSDFMASSVKVIENKDNVDAWKKEEQRLIIEIAKNPKNSKLYADLGDLYIKMGDLSDAKESLEAAMELDPSNEELKIKHSRVVEKLNTQISQS